MSDDQAPSNTVYDDSHSNPPSVAERLANQWPVVTNRIRIGALDEHLSAALHTEHNRNNPRQPVLNALHTRLETLHTAEDGTGDTDHQQ